ncbi:MAG: hypothetical protein ACRDHP_07115, partial [Ktedonobacterales bacterium]
MRRPHLPLLLALLAALLPVLALTGCGEAGGVSPQLGRLDSVAEVAASDVWAVGTVILHYDGYQWRHASDPVTSELRSVAMLSATDGWAVGSIQASATAPHYALLLHYDGATWQRVTLPQQYFDLSDIFMVSPSEGWA